MILLIIGAVLLIWFLLPVFSHRILNIGNVTGLAVGLVLFLYGLFFVPFNHFIAWFWQKPAGKIIEVIVGLCILAVLVLAVMTMVCMGRGMRTGNAVDLSKGGKTVIVLGCKAIGERPSLMLEERLQAALAYLEAYPDSYAVVSGGQGKDEILTEADVMYNWLVEHGIEPDRLIKEDRSTDTHENLKYCYEILAGSSLGTDIVIVTNEFHEYRALKIAGETGFQAEPLPAKTAWWLFPTYYVREMYGILESWFLQ